jgi:putative radical SAM enzyme (TIGR03279 family)
MVRVKRVENDSKANFAGLCPGDRILSINGQAVKDFIDFHFFSAESSLKIEVRSKGESEPRILYLEREAGKPLGIGVDEGSVRRCRNKCIFCFVDQLPSGLRQSLYVKDEDYRYSFLRGNFITGTSLRNGDLDRIIGMGLGPLYISVHATDPEVRRRMLGWRSQAEVMPLLERLVRGGVGLHFQVVLCPGINDGPVLEKTILDLEGLGTRALSMAVVPVGLSRYRRDLARLEPVTPAKARAVLKLIHACQRDFLSRRGGRFVFAADEFYLLSGARIPSALAYEGYTQLENGVGLLRRSMDSLGKILRGRSKLPSRRDSRYVIVTGQLFASFVRKRLFPRIRARVAGKFTLTAVRNYLLGETVTVAGLLAGRDILKAMQRVQPADIYLLPASAINSDGLFIDDLHLDQLRAELAPAVIITAEDLADALALIAEREKSSSPGV